MTPVIITNAAIRDIGEIWDQIARVSSDAATRTSDEVIDRSLSLKDMPRRYPRVAAYGDEIRRFHVGPWAVYYEVLADCVEVLRVVYGPAQHAELALRPDS